VLSADQWSAGFLYDANHTNYFASDAEIQNLTAAPPWTCACAFNPTTIGSGSIPFCRTAANSGGQPYMNWCFQNDFSLDNHLTFGVNSGGSYTYVGTAGSGGAAVPANGFHTLVGVANSQSSASYFVDAVSQGTTTGLSIQSVNSGDAICFGGNSSAGIANPCAGAFIPYGAFWNRALSASEILQLHLDPYCFLLPPESELPALYLAGSTIVALAAHLVTASKGLAAASGITGLAARTSATAKGAPTMVAVAALRAMGRASSATRAPLSGIAGLSAQTAVTARTGAAMAGVAALAARGASRVGASVGGLFKIGLSARGSSLSSGAAAGPKLFASLSARGSSLSSGGAGFRGVVAMSARGFVAATGQLIAAFLAGNLTANPRFTIKLGLPVPQGPDFSVMDVGETVTGAIDFAKWLPSGVTIQDDVATAAVFTGAKTTFAALTVVGAGGSAPHGQTEVGIDHQCRVDLGTSGRRVSVELRRVQGRTHSPVESDGPRTGASRRTRQCPLSRKHQNRYACDIPGAGLRRDIAAAHSHAQNR